MIPKHHFRNIIPLIFSTLLSIQVSAQRELNEITYLALGDSYTIGESVEESNRWPVALTTALNNSEINVQPPKIIARTGWTTDELMEAISSEAFTESFDLVSLLIGVNNQYRGYDFSQFKNEFNLLLDEAIKLGGGSGQNVFVVSIPDYGVSPFGMKKNPGKIAKEIDQYNKYQLEICEKRGIPFINITEISRRQEAGFIAKDDLHPSGIMYQKWVEEEILSVVSNLIK